LVGIWKIRCPQPLDETAILRSQDSIGQAFTQLTTIAAEATRERMAHFASEPDTAPLLRTLVRLRHDLVMIRTGCRRAVF
jgi:hypothetical protein